MRTGKIHAAKLENSQRLQRVLSVLWEGGWISTWDISRRGSVCAVNSCIAELRALGYTIYSRCIKESFGAPARYEYQLKGERHGKADVCRCEGWR